MTYETTIQTLDGRHAPDGDAPDDDLMRGHVRRYFR